MDHTLLFKKKEDIRDCTAEQYIVALSDVSGGPDLCSRQGGTYNRDININMTTNMISNTI